jgi:ribosomal protein S6--L-glutamate ligase
MKLCILTAEPDNFVPQNLKKEAEAKNWECDLVNPNNIILDMTSDGYVAKLDGKELGDYDFVIPRFSEHNLDVKLDVLDYMLDKGAKTFNTPTGMRLSNDKLLSAILFAKNKIASPRTVLIHDTEHLDEVLESFEYPVILKTIHGTHGIGVMKCDSKGSAKSVAQTLIKEKVPYLLQEFVEHKSSARIIMIGNDMLAANTRGQPEKSDDFRTNSHMGSETQTYAPPENEIELCRQLTGIFDGLGFCAIDYIVQEDKILVLEINGSPGLEAIQKDYPDKNLPEAVIAKMIEIVEKGGDVVEPEYPEVPEKSEPENPEVIDLTDDGRETSYVGFESEITLKRINDGQPLACKIDTGAGLCSLDAKNINVSDNIVTFDFNDSRYQIQLDRMIYIKKADHIKHERPVIRFTVDFAGQTFEDVEFTLADRENLKFPVLIGKNLLSLGKIAVKSE